MSDHHSASHYVKIWGILLVLLVISVIGPEFGIKWVTLITAFGIAIVKAWMVAKYFMHLDTERPMINYMLISMVIFCALFFAGVSADVMRVEGYNWSNEAAKQHIEDNKHLMEKLHAK